MKKIFKNSLKNCLISFGPVNTEREIYDVKRSTDVSSKEEICHTLSLAHLLREKNRRQCAEVPREVLKTQDDLEKPLLTNNQIRQLSPTTAYFPTEMLNCVSH